MKFSPIRKAKKFVSSYKISGNYSNSINDPSSSMGFRRKLVRIIITDGDATDTSSEEEEDYNTYNRGKQYEFRIEVTAKTCHASKGKDDNDNHRANPRRKVRRQRNLFEEANVYKNGARSVKRPVAVANFTALTPTGSTCNSECPIAFTPASILCDEKLTASSPFNFDHLDLSFNPTAEIPFSAMDFWWPKKYFREEEFGDLETNDFPLEILTC